MEEKTAVVFQLPLKLGEPPEALGESDESRLLTDEFRRKYGEYLLSHEEYRDEVGKAVQSIRRYSGRKPDLRKDRDLIVDLLYSRDILQFRPYEYFVYRFRDRPISERLNFIQGRYQDRYNDLLNDKEGIRLLRDKYRTYLRLKEYFKRDIVMVRGRRDLLTFRRFLKTHDRFALKPNKSNSGTGFRIADGPASLPDTIRLIRENAPFVAEELIVPCEEFKSIYPKAVNTVRFYTFLCGDGSVKPFMAFLRAGQGNMIVDNMGSGGMMCLVDADTGVICTNAVDENCREYVTHPDTGFRFMGHRLPAWSELLDITLKIGAMIPGARFIGWDCTYSKDRGWQIVEGNGYGTLSLMQMPIHEGLKSRVESFFAENY